MGEKTPDILGSVEPVGEPLDVKPRHEILNSEIGALSTDFGNSGLFITTSRSIGLPYYDWVIEFMPEENYARFIKDEDNYDQVFHASNLTMKYSRMFAAGLLSLFEFVNKKEYETAEAGVRNIYERFPPHRLEFDSNDRMMTFAKKLLGEMYFSYYDNNEHVGIFNLSKFLDDVQSKPELLEKIKKLANPEKLKNIRVVDSQ